MTQRQLASTTRILQDDQVVEPAAIRMAADELASRLLASRPGRVALCSPRADVVAVALAACERSGVELLLLRKMPSPSMLESWGVGTTVQDDLALSRVNGVVAKQPKEFAVLLTTSGTTGVPKVASHTLERLLGRIRQPGPTSAPPTWLLTYHPASFAGMQVILTALLGGGELVACSQTSVTDLAAAALRHGATHISATPTFWRAFLMALGPAAAQLPLRHATLGGERADQAVLDRMTATFPQAVIAHIYASTEAGALFAVRDGLAGFPARWLGEPVDGVRLRINAGVLEAQSPRAMLGYVAGSGHDPVTSEGWLNTNDRVEQHGDRVLFMGRMDAVINVGGANVSAEAVEAVLLRVPGVADVRVTGVSNPISGQVVSADLMLDGTRDADATRRAVLALARAELELYQVPRIVRIVNSIEYSETGKKLRT